MTSYMTYQPQTNVTKFGMTIQFVLQYPRRNPTIGGTIPHFSIFNHILAPSHQYIIQITEIRYAHPICRYRMPDFLDQIWSKSNIRWRYGTLWHQIQYSSSAVVQNLVKIRTFEGKWIYNITVLSMVSCCHLVPFQKISSGSALDALQPTKAYKCILNHLLEPHQ